MRLSVRAIVPVSHEFTTRTTPVSCEQGARCAICQYSLQRRHWPVAKLPCGHVLHRACVQQWFERGCSRPGKCKEVKAQWKLRVETQGPERYLWAHRAEGRNLAHPLRCRCEDRDCPECRSSFKFLCRSSFKFESCS